MRFYEGVNERYTAFYNHEFLPEEMINHPASFATKCVYNTHGVFDQRYKIAADYDFMLRLYFLEKETGERLFYPYNKSWQILQ